MNYANLITLFKSKIEKLEQKLERLREDLSPEDSKNDVVDGDVEEECVSVSEKA